VSFFFLGVFVVLFLFEGFCFLSLFEMASLQGINLLSTEPLPRALYKSSFLHAGRHRSLRHWLSKLFTSRDHSMSFRTFYGSSYLFSLRLKLFYLCLLNVSFLYLLFVFHFSLHLCRFNVHKRARFWSLMAPWYHGNSVLWLHSVNVNPLRD